MITFPATLDRESGDWQPFESAPKDGRVFRIRRHGWAFTHARYRDGTLTHIEFQHTNNPTQWAPVPTN